MRWKGPTWQAKTIISCFPNWKKAYSQAEHMIGIRTHDPISVSRLPTCDQSAPQECRFATLTKNKNKNKPSRIKTRPLTFRLGQVTSENQHFPLLQLFIIDFKLSFKLRVALPKMRKKVFFLHVQCIGWINGHHLHLTLNTYWTDIIFCGLDKCLKNI